MTLKSRTPVSTKYRCTWRMWSSLGYGADTSLGYCHALTPFSSAPKSSPRHEPTPWVSGTTPRPSSVPTALWDRHGAEYSISSMMPAANRSACHLRGRHLPSWMMAIRPGDTSPVSSVGPAPRYSSSWARRHAPADAALNVPDLSRGVFFSCSAMTSTTHGGYGSSPCSARNFRYLGVTIFPESISRSRVLFSDIMLLRRVYEHEAPELLHDLQHPYIMVSVEEPSADGRFGPALRSKRRMCAVAR